MITIGVKQDFSLFFLFVYFVYDVTRFRMVNDTIIMIFTDEKKCSTETFDELLP